MSINETVNIDDINLLLRKENEIFSNPWYRHNYYDIEIRNKNLIDYLKYENFIEFLEISKYKLKVIRSKCGGFEKSTSKIINLNFNVYTYLSLISSDGILVHIKLTQNRNDDFPELSLYITGHSIEADSVLNEINDFYYKKLSELTLQQFTNNLYCISTNEYGSLKLSELTLDDSTICDNLYLNYNDELLIFNETLKEAFTTKHKGIAILHGEPGTGKTSYIKWLAKRLVDTNKKIVFVPPNLTAALGSPQFMNFCTTLGKDGIVFIIEDAETALLSRTISDSGAVSNILNLTDGILNDLLKVQVICTINTKLSEIDKALLRPGRLIGEFKFDKLTANKTRNLVKELHGEEVVPLKEEMTLAEIYHMKAMPTKVEKVVRKIGFV